MKQEHNKLYVLLICVALALTTIVVFWQVRQHEFISFDDDLYIINNSHVNSGLTPENIIWASKSIYAYNWHPLTWISHMLDCELYGLNPGGHHFTNVLFHVANALLLFWVLRRMTGRLWPSAFVAAAFALHPMHVESVAWVAERKDVLSTFFWILTMWAYVRYAERPDVGRYLLVVLAFCLGLMAKQMLVTLPFVLLLLDYWPLGRFTFKEQISCNSAKTAISGSARQCILEKRPLFILSAVAGVIVYIVQQHTRTVKSLIEYSLSCRIGNALVAYIAYIGKMLWPSHLAIFYPHPQNNLPTWQIAGSALLLVCITTAVIWKIRQRPYLAVGWLWFLGTLVPVIGLVQVGLQAYADRYTYMSLTGLFIIIAWGISDLTAKLRYQKAFVSLSAAVLLLTLGVTTWHQVRHWHNNITLYKHTTAVVRNNWWAYNNLGTALEKQGKLDEAVEYYTETLRIKPDSADAHYNLGFALFRQDKLNDAIRCWKETVRLDPSNHEAYHNLGIAFYRQGNIKEAIIYWTETVKRDPGNQIARNNLEAALYQLRKTGQTIE